MRQGGEAKSLKAAENERRMFAEARWRRCGERTNDSRSPGNPAMNDSIEASGFYYHLFDHCFDSPFLPKIRRGGN